MSLPAIYAVLTSDCFCSVHLERLLGYADSEYVVENISIFVTPYLLETNSPTFRAPPLLLPLS